MTRRLRAAAAVAGRPGVEPALCGPTFSRPRSLDRRDAAAAGADLDHVDGRDQDRQAAALLEAVDAVDLEIAGHQRLRGPR